jgi:hypothetical protein
MLISHPSSAQQRSATAPLDSTLLLPKHYLDRIQGRYSALDQKVTTQTEKYLKKLSKQEAKIKKWLLKVDPGKARQLYGAASLKYTEFASSLTSPLASRPLTAANEYVPGLDSIGTSLSFLSQNTGWAPAEKDVPNQVQGAQASVSTLQAHLQQSQEIRTYITQRKEELQALLSGYTHLPAGVTRAFTHYKQESYYYSEQLREYRNLLNEPPEKLVKKGLVLLNKLPVYQQFLKEHSELAGLFSLPPSYSNAQNLAGLQTREQVQSLIQNRLAAAGTGGLQAVQANLQAAQAQLTTFKEKLSKLGNHAGDMTMPDFKPNSQRTQPLVRRLEYGFNLQTIKSSSFYPSQVELGLSAGFKLNDKSTVGLGVSTAFTTGDIRHISVAGQGVGLRSYIDLKLKGSFFASGGFEYNYAKPFSEVRQLYALDSWSKSGLLGISKIVSLKNKWFKKTKASLLWDFLSYCYSPRIHQPIKFRLGYNF